MNQGTGRTSIVRYFRCDSQLNKSCVVALLELLPSVSLTITLIQTQKQANENTIFFRLFTILQLMFSITPN